MPATAPQAKGGRERSRSPPKAAATRALREALDEARGVGGCNMAVLGQAEAALKQAEEMRERQKRDAARQGEKRGRSPARRTPGGVRQKSADDELAKLERKLIRQKARGM